jgi:hypothetical protein
MASENTKQAKAIAKAADLVLDLLSDLPKEKAKAAKAELRALAVKSSRSANHGNTLRVRKISDPRLSRRSSAKSS